jgi:hypothetical protein
MLYPKARLQQAIDSDSDFAAQIVNSLNVIPASRLTGEGRVYGGAMFKLEPRELGNLPVPELEKLLVEVPESRQLAPLGWEA